MKFFKSLVCLVAAIPLAAQLVAVTKGGGTLRIAEASYRFEPTGLAWAAPKNGQPGAYRLKGRLVPGDGGRAFDVEFVLLKDGRLYDLKIHRQGADGYPDSWAATTKTKVKALALEDRPGGRIQVSIEGPLAGVLGKKPVTGACTGTIWAAFPEEGGDDFS